VIRSVEIAEGPRTRRPSRARPPSATTRFHRDCLLDLTAGGHAFLVGGGYALERYLGAGRSVGDLDLFVHPDDLDPILRHLDARGYRTERLFPHWLAKVWRGREHIDVIFDSGNAACPVDDEWFGHGVPAKVLDIDVRLCPPEEMIWSKAFVMERERFDGADVAHLLRACGERLDWPRLVRRFGLHWQVLFAHLVLFSFIYPGERHRIPPSLMRRGAVLVERETRERVTTRVCRGTLLSRAQYLVDIAEWGYEDARLAPFGAMTEEAAAIWTAAIDEEASRPLAPP